MSGKSSGRAKAQAAQGGGRKSAHKLNVAVQFATTRSGVPHARTLAAWANAAVAGAPASVRSGELAIRVVGSAESRKLNRTWRGKDKPTNVLSFPSGADLRPRAGRADPQPLGDLAICAPVVAREAREQGKSPHSHWAHMVVHGVLHLLGYDHENDRDAAIMETAETDILRQFGYSDPYA